MSKAVGYGILDGDAVRFAWDLTEAWVLINDVWKKIHPAETTKAGVLSEADFGDIFPDAPPLPTEAFK